MTISIQGQLGPYHHQVAAKLYGESVRLICRDNFKEVFDDVLSGQADYAVCAIENSSVGSINEVYDLLRHTGLYIIGEHYMRISHCLIGLMGVKVSDIKSVHSHPMALLQCESYLESQLPKADIHERHDTAESVEHIKRLNDSSQAAIGSAEAAKLHKMTIIDSDIETDRHNYTRFLILQKRNGNLGKNDVNKTSIMIELADKPGSLYHALGCFESENINLSKLESRPILGHGWRYYFYIDFEAGIKEQRTKRALSALSEQGHELAILGSYKRGIAG